MTPPLPTFFALAVELKETHLLICAQADLAQLGLDLQPQAGKPAWFDIGAYRPFHIPVRAEFHIGVSAVYLQPVPGPVR